MTNSTLSTVLQLLTQVLDSYEVDTQSIISRAGINLKQDSRVSMRAMNELWELSVQETVNQELGLVAASMFQPTYLKGLGLAWMASETLLKGLHLFVDNSQMINTAMQLILTEKGDELIVQYKTKEGIEKEVKAHQCSIQLGIGLILKMLRLAAGKSIPAQSVYFNYEIGDSLPVYEEYFQCEVHQSSGFNGISFSKALLNEQLPTHDSELVAVNEAAVHKYIQKMGSGEVSAKVISLINKLLASGCPSEETIAFKMHMSKRTLQRKLSAEKQSYLQLLNNIRLALAKEHLVHGKISVTEITYQLGYSSPSTFARAFKQQTNFSPLQYRDQYRESYH